MVRELTEQEFKSDVIEAKKLTIVDFWASWCGPCRALAPVYEELSKDYEGTLEFTKISTEEFPQVAADSNVSGIPCMIIFKDGVEAGRIVGFHPKDALKTKIDEILG